MLGILRESGFAGAAAENVAIELQYPGTARQGAELACAVGAAARVMEAAQGGPEDWSAIVAATATGFEAYQKNGVLRLSADVWVYTA